MNRSRTEIAKPQIASYFSGLKSKVLTYSDVDNILSTQRENWKLAKGMHVSGFLDFLFKSDILIEIKLRFSHKTMVRYAIGSEIDVYELASKLSSKGYFSHGSAIYLHNLHNDSDFPPEVIYINEEQPKNNSGNGVLRQESIDTAFIRPARTSNNKTKIGDYTIVFLNGMNTNKLGVEDYTINDISLSITNLERTLIDAPSPRVFLCPIGQAARDACVGLLATIRRSGIAAEMDYTGRKLKTMLEQADRLRAHYVVIVGDEELALGVVQLRNQMTAEREQRTVPMKDVSYFLTH